MIPRLGVNIDHVATLRQQRKIGFPDVVAAARLARTSGADSITVHLREDRRHIQDKDVFRLVACEDMVVNLEMACVPEIIRVAIAARPARVCVVPERRRELTTEGGLDIIRQSRQITACVEKLKKRNIGVSLFVDPDPRQVTAARNCGADAVEIHTGSYADARTARERSRTFGSIMRAAEVARAAGLLLHAGHGLDYTNVAQIARIEGMRELNIGFSIIARAVFVGLGRAVQEMKRAIALS